MTSKKQATVESWLPDWVEAIANESLHTDIGLALIRREMATESGAMRIPARRALLRRGDALLARVEKRPTLKSAMDLVMKADDLYSEARVRRRQPAMVSRRGLAEAHTILGVLEEILGHRDAIRTGRALKLAASLYCAAMLRAADE